jgi:hypothetical protein
MKTIRNGNSLVSFRFNEDSSVITATHKCNADDNYYGAQFLQAKNFKKESGARRWACQELRMDYNEYKRHALAESLLPQAQRDRDSKAFLAACAS